MEENSQQLQEEKPSASGIKKLSANKTPLLITALVVLTAILLAVSLAPKKESPIPAITEKLTPLFAQTTLSISEPRVSTTSAQQYEADINIDTGSNKVTGVQIELSYMPDDIRIVDIKSGSFLEGAIVLLKKIDPVNGEISYVIGNQVGSEGVSGKGSVATVSFVKGNLASGDTASLEFLPRTIVSGEGQGETVLKKTTSATFSLDNLTP